MKPPRYLRKAKKPNYSMLAIVTTVATATMAWTSWWIMESTSELEELNRRGLALEERRDMPILEIREAWFSSSEPDTVFLSVMNEGLRATAIDRLVLKYIFPDISAAIPVPIVDFVDAEASGKMLVPGAWILLHEELNSTIFHMADLVGLDVSVVPVLGEGDGWHFSQAKIAAALRDWDLMVAQ